MRETQQGWVVVNQQRNQIIGSTFNYTKKGAIAECVHSTNATWQYWRKKFGFSCVKATRTIEPFPSPNKSKAQ